MKKMMTSAIALTLMSSSVYAAEVASWQKGGIVTGGAVIGALAGGPVGFLIGAGLGIWINDERDEAAQAQELAMALSQKETHLLALQSELADSRRFEGENLLLKEQVELMAGRIEEMTIDAGDLTFDLNFRTDESHLSDKQVESIRQLASLISSNPGVQISLQGYADPRGSSEYNFRLSQQRVQAVITALMTAGIDPERIQSEAFGASLSETSPGDLDGYAQERRVSLALFDTGVARTF